VKHSICHHKVCPSVRVCVTLSSHTWTTTLHSILQKCF